MSRPVRSLESRIAASIKIDPGHGCWIWTATLNMYGYGRIFILEGGPGEGQWQMAHRVAYKVFVGPIPDGLGVLHHCDNPPCCNPAHLFVGTPRDNTVDRQKKGRFYRDGIGLQSRLTAEQVREIRTSRALGTPRRVLAEKLGVSVNTISNWQHGRCGAPPQEGAA